MPVDVEYLKNRKNKITDPEKNPCWKEAGLSRACLDNNQYKYDRCSEEFENYRNCKKFWRYVEQKRRIAQITPSLPPIEERDAAIEAHLDNFMEGR